MLGLSQASPRLSSSLNHFSKPCRYCHLFWEFVSYQNNTTRSGAPVSWPERDSYGTIWERLFYHEGDNVAFVRGEMDCGCTYCTNSAKLTMAEHDVHVAWHNKYRRFFALRAQKYPTLKDMGVLNVNLENAMRCWPIWWSYGDKWMLMRPGFTPQSIWPTKRR